MKEYYSLFSDLFSGLFFAYRIISRLIVSRFSVCPVLIFLVPSNNILATIAETVENDPCMRVTVLENDKSLLKFFEIQ